ncbi:MAG TPA: right-handed parallel beta-helix repeat-containing protein [Candidatus Eisenbacteria bacterium]
MTRRYQISSRALPALLLVGLLAPAAVRAETRVGGTLSGQVQWTKAASPYVVTEDITIPVGSKLSIGPGVLVKFRPNLADQKGVRPFDLEIAVYGTLECSGADGDSVYLTSDSLDPSTQDWAGICVEKGGMARIDRMVLDSAATGISVTDGEIDLSRSTIRACSEKGLHFQRGKGRVYKSLFTMIGNFAGTAKGISLVASPDVLIDETFVIGAQIGIGLERNSDATIRKSLISLCRSYGIQITSSSPKVTENNIAQNEFGMLIRGRSEPVIKDNNIFDNASWELQVRDYRANTPGEMPTLDLSGNWWGKITPDVAYDRIDDGNDNPSAGAAVKIEPVRPQAWEAR